jgi:hypothetical protein
LKGYRLCVMGQLDSNVQSPTAVVRVLVFEHLDKPLEPQVILGEQPPRDVAVGLCTLNSFDP